MRIPSQTDRTETDAATTPMIDVVFLLLIFFVCTASFQAPESMLPGNIVISGGSAPIETVEPPPPLDRVVVKAATEARKPLWKVNERKCDSLAEVQAVLAAVHEIDADIPVILDIAGEIPLGDAIDVYDICRVVGFGRVQFAAESR